MKAIAITGSLGSGKSTALKIFRSLGFPIIDCDALVAKLYKKKAVQKKLSKLFGTSSPKKMLSIMLSSKQKRRLLEKTLHPLVWKQLRQKLSSFRKQGKALAFAEVPLLFEAKWHKRFDAIIFVHASKKKCMQRLAKKGFPRKHALLLQKAQLSPKKKIKSSHYTINNNGNLAKTREQARQVAELLKNA